MHASQIILAPVMSEKSYEASTHGTYTFKVRVAKVRTSRQLGKIRRVGRHMGRRPDWKKAYVTLAEGSRIDFFEGA